VLLLQYYMKTGECKYGIKCRFDHPKERPESGSHNDQTQQAVTPVKAAAFNSKGLPIRPVGALYLKHESPLYFTPQTKGWSLSSTNFLAVLGRRV
jgi:hypothetical protein